MRSVLIIHCFRATDPVPMRKDVLIAVVVGSINAAKAQKAQIVYPHLVGLARASTVRAGAANVARTTADYCSLFRARKTLTGECNAAHNWGALEYEKLRHLQPKTRKSRYYDILASMLRLRCNRTVDIKC